MIYVLNIVAFFWAIRIIGNLSSFVHLWYVKEYRIDRMLIHLQTKQGKRLLFLPWRRPPVSPKSVFIFLFSAISLLVLFIFIPYGVLVELFILDILSFLVTLFFVVLSMAPTLVYHRFLIRKSMQLLSKHKKMLVIGITGSYGKTTTKEILYTLLSQKYKTLKTEASKNSPIAIAELILSKLKSEHEILIVEMGAYKTGEIAEMCSMVRPDIGIVTAINAQHQDLFGSLENTVKAKYELIAGLTGRRIAIVNADNPHVLKMGEQASREGCDVKSYVNSMAHAIEETSKGLKFIVELNNKAQNIEVQLFGKHQISNMLAAIMAANCCGMTLNEIARAALSIKPFPKTMQPVVGVNGSRFIDDTFNNNPDAARAAIAYLATQKSRRIFIFQPMVELGVYAEDSHVEVGVYASKVCDDIILTNDNFYESFLKGVRSVDPSKNVHVMDAKNIARYIRGVVKKGDTVLFKGKESGKALSLLL